VNAICEKYFSVLNDLKVLEVGCGTVKNVKNEITKNGCKWTGVDKKVTGLATHVCKVERTPFDDCSFDCVIGCETIQYWKDVNAGLTEVRRVLKDDGTAFFTTSIHFCGGLEFQKGDFAVIEKNFEKNGLFVTRSELWRRLYKPLQRYLPEPIRRNLERNGITVDDNLSSCVYFCEVEK